MAQVGTFGFYENGKYKAWGIQAGDYWRVDNIEDIFKNDFSRFYQYIQKHGEKKFKKKILEHPRGYMYPEFDVSTGELKGDGDEWTWGEGEPDDESVLETRFSPYVNMWLDIDNKTINLVTKDRIQLSVSYSKKQENSKEKRMMILDIYDGDFEFYHFMKTLNQLDKYLFITQYEVLREVI